MHKPTLVLTGVVIGLATLCGVQRTHEFERAVKLDTVYASTVSAKRLEVRKVYPHSLIPGGVRSVEELRIKVSQNVRLSDWYSEFDFTHAVPCRLPAGRYFVTYDDGQKISWSRTTVEKGEQSCITDGKRSILTKCGNEVLFSTQDIDNNEPPYEIEAPVYEEIEVPKLSTGTQLLSRTQPAQSGEKFFGIVPIVWGNHNPQPSEPVCTDPIEFGKSCN